MLNSPGIRIRAHLTQLEAELRALQELDPSATPGTLKKRDELITEIQKRMSQMSAMNIIARRPPNDSVPDPQADDDINIAAEVDPSIVRFESLLPKFDRTKFPPFTAQDFRQRLVMPDSGARIAIEDRALERIIRGYTDSGSNWHDVLSPMVENHDEWEVIGESTQAMRKIEDEVERIEAMEEFLDARVAVGSSQMFVDWVMRGIETVRYVKIWDGAPGERKWKIDYLKKTFKANNGQLVGNLFLVMEAGDEKAKAQAKKTYQAKLDSHRKRHYRTIENRRPLALLYDHFGAAVFLEPTWDVMDKGQKRARSSTFGGLLVHMPDNLPKEDGISIPAKRSEAARNALVEIVGIFAPALVDYVEDFLDDYLPVHYGTQQEEEEEEANDDLE
ncbi:hypothetical protein IW261DRAFT_1602057 [Armillaria novae-zelandiae]|uniref:Uncharacterized protein n=1 Tax=Armillaria novae-zelandiae TaxID=153914 RepID=A0AA39TJ33_9AGAR|nr:hypothetical protein IW261DRAFT_1602057 [Armillaria novae-zelandiae]